jgi:hypothetical protein
MSDLLCEREYGGEDPLELYELVIGTPWKSSKNFVKESLVLMNILIIHQNHINRLCTF